MGEGFNGRHVVVTGFSGALGSGVVDLLVARGAVCHLPARGAAARRLRDAPPGRVHVTAGIDLTDEAAVGSFFADLPELWASVHCAGGFDMAPVLETTLEELSQMWSINVATAFLCCREAARVMRAQNRGGRIVNVAARPALEPRTGSGMVAYTASKAALAALTESLAEELAPEGIWVNAVAPSILDTPANREAMPRADPAKWATVAEVAQTILFLASPENGSTRGAVVPVYGRT